MIISCEISVDPIRLSFSEINLICSRLPCDEPIGVELLIESAKHRHQEILGPRILCNELLCEDHYESW